MQSNPQTRRDGERGAALITMLLVATLILVAGGALIVSTATSATNAIDAATERQAFYAAEAGLQLSLNALRGNMRHDGAVANNTTMNFRAAVTPDLSNGAGRNGGDNTMCAAADADNSRCRLAGWLPYIDPSSNTSRVLTNPNAPFDPNNPFPAFRVTVYDPDNSQNVTFSTSGSFTVAAGLPFTAQVINGGQSLLLGVAPNQTRIDYVPRGTTTLLNAVPSANTDFGSFRVTLLGAGFALPVGVATMGTFTLNINQTAPWAASAVFRGTMLTPAVSSCPAEYFHLNFDQVTKQADGTGYTQTSLNNQRQFLIPCAIGGGTQTVQLQGAVAAPQPKRVLVRSWGFGPKWAQKRLEMMVERANLAFEAPATVTIRGADDCSAMTFNSGDSNAKTYSGSDHCRDTDPTCTPDPNKPSFAVTGCDESRAEAGITKPGTVSPDPKIGILDNGTAPGATMSTTPVDTPDFLKTADAARAYLNDLEAAARSEGRYFTGPRTITNADGTPSNPNITFVDGDCTLDDGVGGLVVCTGTLTTSGNVNFSGVLLVMGGGTMIRNGGGSGNINGSVVVSRFARTWPPEENGQPHPFLAPIFNTSGGGNSDVNYNSTAKNNAFNLLGGPRVSGILEF